MPLLAFLNGQTAENSYLVDFCMLKFFMIKPASVSLRSGVSPENQTSSLSPLIHSHMWHLHLQMLKIFWEVQINQYDITEGLNTPKSVLFGVCSCCPMAPPLPVVQRAVAVNDLFRSRFFRHTC